MEIPSDVAGTHTHNINFELNSISYHLRFCKKNCTMWTEANLVAAIALHLDHLTK